MKHFGKALVCIVCIATLAGCGPKREERVADIEKMEASLSATGIAPDDSAAMELISRYRDFAKEFSKDSLAPVYLQRAADMSIGIGRADEAVGLLDTVITMYPEYDDVAGCWFLKGYAFETAGRYDEAREAYIYFADTYPEHYLADDTRKSIPYVGMSAEEMFEAIMNAAGNWPLDGE